MSDFEFNSYIILSTAIFHLNVGYGLIQCYNMFAQSKGKAGLSFIAIIFVWIGITILVAGFIFIIGMAHSRASYYTQLARITLILYPIAGFIYFLLQKRFARNVV